MYFSGFIEVTLNTHFQKLLLYYCCLYWCTKYISSEIKCSFEFHQLSTFVYYRGGLTAVDPRVKRHNVVILSIHYSLQQKQVQKRCIFWNQTICSFSFRGKAEVCTFIEPQLQIRHTWNLGNSKQLKRDFHVAGLTDLKWPLQALAGHLDYSCMQLLLLQVADIKQEVRIYNPQPISNQLLPKTRKEV